MGVNKKLITSLHDHATLKKVDPKWLLSGTFWKSGSTFVKTVPKTAPLWSHFHSTFFFQCISMLWYFNAKVEGDTPGGLNLNTEFSDSVVIHAVKLLDRDLQITCICIFTKWNYISDTDENNGYKETVQHSYLYGTGYKDLCKSVPLATLP